MTSNNLMYRHCVYTWNPSPPFDAYDASCAIGRVDITSLSEQSLMEILVEPLNNSHLRDALGIFQDIIDWKGTTFHSNGTINALSWYYFALGGTMDMVYLPRNLEECDFVACGLCGIITAKSLPTSLIILNLYDNRFSGSVEFQELPRSLRQLFLNRNNFDECVNFSRLPVEIRLLYLDQNRFSGVQRSRKIHLPMFSKI